MNETIYILWRRSLFVLLFCLEKIEEKMLKQKMILTDGLSEATDIYQVSQ